MESKSLQFEYLDLVTFEEPGPADVYMVEDYTYTAAGIEYSVRSIEGKVRRSTAQAIRKVGQLDWPIPFGTKVYPTQRFERGAQVSFRNSTIVGMAYDYVARTWSFAITADDGTVVMAERSDFDVVGGPDP
jgi:hypothetical protein